MKNLILTIVIIICLICIRTAIADKYEAKIQFIPESKFNISDTIVIDSASEFSEENLKIALDQYDIIEPKIVFRQAVLETGHFTSNIFITNNNLFGMKHPSIRKTTSIGEKNGHACYNNWLDSVIDMVLFQDYYNNRISRYDDYYDFLDGIYAEDNSYTRKLKQVEI